MATELDETEDPGTGRVVDAAGHGRRLDQVLAGFFPAYSRTALKDCISGGRVRLDGTVAVKPSLKVAEGQVIEVDFPEPEPLEARPQDLPINVVWSDADLLIIDKPVGLVCHPGAGVPDGTLMNALLYHYPDQAALPRAGIVHRLDRDTAGLMVVARTPLAQQKLTAAISRHEVVREYEAICEGVLTAGGTVEAEIGRDPHVRTRMAVVPDGMGREAVTHYRVLERFRAHTFLRLRLETGRTHQIRVHMAWLGYPLLGDPTYGRRRPFHLSHAAPELEERLRTFSHQALHAVKLELMHPASGETLSFSSPEPPEFTEILTLLRADAKEWGDA